MSGKGMLGDDGDRMLFARYKPGEMTFSEVRNARHDAGPDAVEWQRRLALEDRRAFARELIRDKPWLAPALAALIPAEQLYKGGRVALGMKPGGRSGYFDPWANIGAGWTGIGQGMLDFGKRVSGLDKKP